MVAGFFSASSTADASSWFWNRVPARIDDGSRARAMSVVAYARERGMQFGVSAASARRVLVRWLPEIEAAAGSGGINSALLAALVLVESGGDPRAVSPKGAMGLGQLMPGTVRRYGVRDPWNPAENLKASASYLSDLIDMFRGDLVLALAAYNSGEGAVLQYRGVPPYPETRDYIPRVLGAFELTGRFCETPPRAARRRCELRRSL